MTVFGIKLPAMSSLLLWGLLWEIIGQLKLTFFVPPLSEVIVTLFFLVQTPAFQSALGQTAYAFIAGVSFAILIGIPVGILMGKSRLLDELLLPWVNIFLSAPLTALVPVLMVLFGFGTKNHNHHHDVVRDLDYNTQCSCRGASDQPVAGRNGPQFWRITD